MFEVQIPALNDKSEVVLHPLFDGLSEQTALHHIENRRRQKDYRPIPISMKNQLLSTLYLLV